jgi:hypothetical protein
VSLYSRDTSESHLHAEFVKRVYLQANDICNKEKKATIAADHVIRAMTDLGLEDWIPRLEAALADFKDQSKGTNQFYARLFSFFF